MSQRIFLTWWNQVVKSEGSDTWVDEFANAKSHTNVPLLPVETFLKSSVLKRQVISRLNLKFMCRILEGLLLEERRANANKNNMKNASRTHQGAEQIQRQVFFFFLNMVVDEFTAANLPNNI